MSYPKTPDNRYFIVRGRLWRCSNPNLADDERAALVHKLMECRRALRGQPRGLPENHPIHEQIHEIKQQLGERGPVWWQDGTPDLNRKLVKNSPYADWYRTLDEIVD
jgi:hypothetical protein